MLYPACISINREFIRIRTKVSQKTLSSRYCYQEKCTAVLQHTTFQIYTVPRHTAPTHRSMMSAKVMRTSRSTSTLRTSLFIEFSGGSSSLCVSNNTVCVLRLHNLCILYYLLVHLFVLFNNNNYMFRPLCMAIFNLKMAIRKGRNM